MWKVGDRVRTHSPVHGEMIGTIIETSSGHSSTLLHVRWQTSQTGTIVVKELAGRDDSGWEKIDSASEALETLTQLAPEFLDQLDNELQNDRRLSSPHTLRGYRSDLIKFESWRGERTLTAPLVETYLAHLQEQGLAASTRRRVWAVIRWWVKRLYEREEQTGNEIAGHYAELAFRLSRLNHLEHQGQDVPVKKPPIDQSHFYRLLEACSKDPSAAGIRDAAILSLAWHAGLKRGELISLMEADIQMRQSSQYALSVPTKIGEARQLDLGPECSKQIKKWMALRERDSQPEAVYIPLFVTINRGGRLGTNSMSGEALRLILRKRCQQAGMEGITWGDLRRAFGAKMLRSGEDIRTVQTLLGHKSAATTVGYL